MNQMTEIGALHDAAAEADGADVRQFVTFMVGNEVFAVDMAPVQEIIRVPEVVRVPMAPPTLDGLSNLRGKVLPIISLRRMFAFDERPNDDATRAVVIDLGQPLGFVVDRVSSVIGVEPASIEDVSSLRSTVDTELLSGLIKDVGGHPMIMVLDFEKLIEREFSKIVAATARSSASHGPEARASDGDDEATSDELHLVSFEVAGQEYAIAIEDVQEIVQVPDHIVHVPHSQPHVLGIMTLRNRLLPLVSLRRMFDLPEREDGETSRIVVVALAEQSVGVVMDSVKEVLRVADANVDAMPPLLARDDTLADITRICRLENGDRLVSVVSAQTMFETAAFKGAVRAAAQMQVDETTGNEEVAMNDEMIDDEEQVVVFRLNKEEFAVPIDSVQEIVRVPEQLTVVPRSPSFVEGVINLRGTVLPVIDQRRRFGLPSLERNDRQRIMVFLLHGVRTGFIVDSVAEVLKLPKSAIEPAPRLSGDQARLIGRVANLQKQQRMVQLVDPAHLVDAQDASGLEALAAA